MVIMVCKMAGSKDRCPSPKVADERIPMQHRVHSCSIKVECGATICIKSAGNEVRSFVLLPRYIPQN